KGLGFGAEVASRNELDTTANFSEVMPEDLVKFGLIPEFIGRLPVVATVTSLDREALVNILSEPKNALHKQYARMFEMDELVRKFSDETLEAVAVQTILRSTGARVLRVMMEEVLMPVMHNIPRRDDVARVVVIRKTVRDNVLSTIVSIYEEKP